jgi:hypothetical protein
MFQKLAFCQGTTSRAAEELIGRHKLKGFVKGHDFSRAANAAKSTRALQLAEKLQRSLDKCQGTTSVSP